MPITRVTLSLIMDCQNDVPQHMLEWMRRDLERYARHAYSDFGYKPESVYPRYVGLPSCQGNVKIPVHMHVEREVESDIEAVQRVMRQQTD